MHRLLKKRGRHRLQTSLLCLLVFALIFPVQTASANVSRGEAQPEQKSHVVVSMQGERALNASPDADPCFTISGTVTRMDRKSRQAGWDSAVTGVPVRSAVVKLMESDTFFDDNYGETTTDPNGNYRFDEFCDDDGFFDDELEIYVLLRAEIKAGGDTVVEVEDSSYVDEVYEYEIGLPAPSSTGGSFTVDFMLNEAQSGVFNIADAIYDAWNFWNASGGAKDGDTQFDYAAEVHYEPGYGDDTSYYEGYITDEITIADSPDDLWDDSVIIHEWGHMTDDKYGCDDADGGAHSSQNLYSGELAWSEGWATYLQSAVRQWRGDADGNLYVDAQETGGFRNNIETWDVNNPTLVSTRNEIAVAALLWDLIDTNIDGQDTITGTHGNLQNLFTDSKFTNNGFFDDDCDATMFSRIWVDTGRPKDGPTAAVFEQNVGLTYLTGTQLNRVGAAGATPSNVRQAQQLMESQDDDYKWWDQTIFVVDNSASMGNAGKLDAVKSVIRQQTTELEAEQKEGVEFNLHTFSNASAANNPIFGGQFFAESVAPYLAGIAPTTAVDTACPVNAFGALTQALEGEHGVDAWLYTDGDTVADQISTESMQQLLADRSASASFVSLGTCAPVVPVDGNTIANDGTAPYLQTPPQSPTAGIVPYLMTALGSGGQFLSVTESQLADAKELLLAQVTHSAGAGRWSDYVSDKPTYRYDRLTNDEYEWLDITDGKNNGKPGDNEQGDEIGRGSEGSVDVALQSPVKLYGFTVSNFLGFENGVLVGKPFVNQTVDATNQPLASVERPVFALMPFWDDLEWDNHWIPDAGGDGSPPPSYADFGTIYTKVVNRWQVIQYHGFGTADNVKVGLFAPVDFVPEEFQVQINIDTGEIRYLYRNLESGVGGATIGIRGLPSVHADPIQVAHNNSEIDLTNSGYKYIPVPPQSTKTYTVSVDSLMEGVGFLLTGYSGTFEPLVVRDPSGTEVDLSDSANVLALDLGLVQYVQVDVDGRVGDWTVDVTAGDSGSGTFAFSSIAASAITAESPTARSLSTNDVQTFLVQMDGTIDNNQLTGRLRTPQGEPFGAGFMLYDDGQHGDNGAGDGLFGSDAFGAPGVGTAYLLVEGSVDSAPFQRSDSRPFHFQPLSVTSQGDSVNLGRGTPLVFTVRNDDAEANCYDLTTSVPVEWSALGLTNICLEPGQEEAVTINVYMGDPPVAGPAPTNNKPSGLQGRVILSVVEKKSGEIRASASALVTRVREAHTIEVTNPNRYLRPNGDQGRLRLSVFDEQGVPVADAPIQLSTTLGTIPAAVNTVDGTAFVTFTTGSEIGLAQITATASNALSATTTIDIASAVPNQIALDVSLNTLPADGTSPATLTATVRDRWGDPVADWPIRMGVEGGGDTEHDPRVGTVNEKGYVDAKTDSNGQATITYRAGTEPGTIRVRADLLVPDGDSTRPIKSATQEIALTGSGVSDEIAIFLPIVQK